MEATSFENQQTSDNETLPCKPDDEYKYHVYTAVYIVVFLFGILFNGLAIYIFCFINKKKGISTVCLLNLAAADLIFIIFLPLRIFYFLNGASWIFGDFLCRITMYSFYFSMYSSIYFLACLSGFRYMSVVFPGKIDVKKVIKLIAFLWVFTAVSTSPFLLSGSRIRENKTRCFEPSDRSAWNRIMYMNYYALILGFIVPFSVILTCNGLLIRHVINIPMAIRSIRKQVSMIVLVLLVCLVCFLPYHIQRTIHIYYVIHHPTICSLHDVLQKTVVATLCLAILNSCLDPLLYVFVGHGFKAWLLIICGPKNIVNVIPSTSDSGVAKALVDEVQMNDT